MLGLAFYPMLRAVPGGQNTTLSLLLLALALRSDRDGRPFVAGLALAALLFKPQFGVVIVPLLLVAKRWRVLGGWATGAFGLWALSSVLTGGTWVAEWWDQAGAFRDENLVANGANFVSLPGFFENLIGSEGIAAPAFGYGLAAVFGLGVAYFWWRHPRSHQLERYALVAAAVVLAAPQTLYYDAGLMLLGLAVAATSVAKIHTLGMITLVALSWSHLAADDLGWSPLAPLIWAAAALLCWLLLRPSGSEPTPV
jgi:hypothetical protein